MNIAIDVLAILGPDSKNRGIGNYNVSQFKRVFQQDIKNNYFLLNFYEDINLQEVLKYSENVKEFYFYTGENGFLIREKSYRELIGAIVKKFIKENQIDIFYITSPFDRLMSYDLDWLKGTKVVMTVYDIIPYLFKERYLKPKEFYHEYMSWIEKLKRADKILAISQSVKNDLIEHIGINAEKINVIYAGVEEHFKTIEVNDADIIRKTYGINSKFVMCTGGDDDRKNIAELIIAFSKMPRDLINKFQLVIACKLSKASESRYYDIAKKHGIEGRVILTNFVPLDHLIKLYNMAHVMAFPSQYEGFGLPVVEAMACGTPVLTSNNSSLGEIAGDAAVLVDPFDIKDITRGLIEILENNDLDKLITKGYQQIRKFTWNKVAERTIQSLESLDLEQSRKLLNLDRMKKKKLAFFTPLPPIKSGIADYSVDIIENLVEFFDIDVFVDINYEVEYKFEQNVKIFPFTEFPRKKSDYFDVIYQMGNSEYHAYMIKCIQTYPGTVVLHDYNLHGLLYHLAKKKNDLNLYREFLYEDYEKSIVDSYVNDFEAGKSGLKIYELATNGVVTNYANKIIVHSDYAKRLLLQGDIGRSVKKILLYSKIEEIKDKKHIRLKLNMPEDIVVISAFGHIHETKRIVPIIKAFNLVKHKFDNVRLYLVGKPSPSIADEIKNIIVSHKLDQFVYITGFTELPVFEEYIDASDICMNLRYPYNGETSASLMRILGKGKCAVINDIGSFSEVPDDCCVKLKSAENMSEEQEVEEIYNNLYKLISHPEIISHIGKNAINYAKFNLNIEKIKVQYRDFLNDQDKSFINEKNLTDIMINLMNYSDNDIYNLSATLAYLKS
ncbi:Glycosyltransferase involved in cell wall bisynthesis [Paenibacillus barengoltzii]|jgi:glycosyltransferase involved in cell wall biosynthesis|uniref:glycosyltransferase n=1 Tax=Paenibacillus barengoltzii TaxID=343517 RepID=UPI000A086AF9|nr:glycosyltransferase [Paenibacillus barengoltzii]SMF32073.1 Glycosyltransferase involved in cell wall bisynthesis [Paenibacillus barengoltzii]